MAENFIKFLEKLDKCRKVLNFSKWLEFFLNDLNVVEMAGNIFFSHTLFLSPFNFQIFLCISKLCLIVLQLFLGTGQMEEKVTWSYFLFRQITLLYKTQIFVLHLF